LLAAPATWSQEPTSTPSPKALWDAYPLEPDQAPATATPSAEFSAAPSANASRPAAGSDDGGVSWIVAILLAAPLVFAAGLLVGHRRNRAGAKPAPAADAGAQPAAPTGFQRREYPKPARPAPPPPPVPGQRADEADDEREPDSVRSGRFKQKEKEPH
jgi:hypothetical protein